jgi:hypothetical protein
MTCMENMSKLTASQTDQGANPAFDDVSCTSFPQFLQAVKDVKMRGPHARMRNEEAAYCSWAIADFTAATAEITVAFLLCVHELLETASYIHARRTKVICREAQ